MKGVRILVHAVRQVAGNLGMALRVSLLPFTLVAGAFVLLGVGLTPASGSPDRAVDVSFSAIVLGMLAAAVFAWAMVSWIAVRWHRYVLLEEGSGWIPPWNGRLVVNYMLTSLLIALIVGIGAIIAVVVPMVAAAGGLWLVLLPLAVQLVATWVFLRLSISLPAFALGGGMTLGEAWARTRPAAGAIAVLTASLFVLNLGSNALGSLATLAGLPGLLVEIVSVPLDWALALLSIAVLTTLYGHLVEGRALG